MKIGELAKKTDVNIETIRFYERKGIIKCPSKPLSGYRNYSNDYIAIIKFVKNAQSLGFSLKEIEDLLSLKVDEFNDCSLVKIKALAKIEEIENKINALVDMKKSLTEITNRCVGSGPTSSCNILNALDTEELR